MDESTWIERLLSSTRGRIIQLLRRDVDTVTALAAALGLTDNAVRAHLAALQADGVVEQTTAPPRGVGKPPQVYTLTPAADALLPKAYGAVLGVLLGVLEERLPVGEMEALMREVGRRAAGGPAAGDDVRLRVDAAYGVLGELGGVADVEEGDGAVWIRGYSCPLASVVPEHPQACRLAEALVSEIVGVPVREHCEKGPRPRCRFEVRLPPAG